MAGMNMLIKRFSVAASAAVCALMFTGCLEVHTEIRFDSSDSGSVRSEYQLPVELARFTEIDPPTITALQPLEKSYILDYLYDIPGVELIDYQADYGDEFHRVTTVISFSDWNGLERLLELHGMAAEHPGDESGIDLLVFPADGDPVADSPFLQDAANGISISVEVRSYAPVTSVDGFPGMSYTGRSARFEVPVVDAATAADSIWMRVRW